MSAREELTDEQRDIILNNALDVGQMLDWAFALGRESVDLAKHDAELGERIAKAIEVGCEHDGRNGKTWCCSRCHEAARIARATTTTEVG